MRFNLSLHKSWTLLALFAVLLPAGLVMLWSGARLYEEQLTSALLMKRQENQVLRNHLEAEVHRLKNLLTSQGDPLSVILEPTKAPPAYPTLQTQLSLELMGINERELAISKLMVLSPSGHVIAAIVFSIGITDGIDLSPQALDLVASQWGFNQEFDFPEFTIPMMGRSYIGFPNQRSAEATFTMSVPIGYPAKGVLVAVIEVAHL